MAGHPSGGASGPSPELGERVRPRPDRVLTRPFVFLWLATFFHFASFFLLIPVLPLYVLKVGGTQAAIGMVIGIFALGSMLVRPAVGHAVDRVSRRPFLLAGPLIFAAAAPVYGIAGSVLALMGTRVLHGSGMGLYTTASLTVATDLAPPHRRGEALGWFQMANSTAMAVGPAVGALVVQATGFWATFLLASALSLVAAVMAANVTIPAHEAQDPNPPAGFIIHPKALAPALLILSASVTYGCVASFVPVLVKDRALGNAGLYFSIFAVGVLIVRAVAGALSDRLGRKAVIVPGLALVAVAMAGVGWAVSTGMLLVAAFIMGLGIGGAQPTIIALTMDRAGRHGRGLAAATFASALELGIAIGAIGSGLLVGAVGYTAMFLLVALVPLVGSVAALWVRSGEEVRTEASK